MSLKYWTGVAVVLLAATVMWADVPSPLPRPQPQPQPANPDALPLVVQLDPKAATPRLLVPRKLIGARSELPLRLLPENEKRADARWSVPTIMAGLALTLGLACGGLWLVRRRGLTASAKALLVAAVILAGACTTAWADLAVPRPVPAGPIRLDQVSIEIVEKGDTVRLIVSRFDWATAKPKDK